MMGKWDAYAEQPAQGGKWDAYAENTAPDVTPPPPQGVGTGPEWSAQYPNLYGLVGAGKAILRSGIETAGTTLGAAAGGILPVPGTSLLGAGAGYAASKRGADLLLGDKPDLSLPGIGKDVAIGAAMQGAGSILSKIPGLNRIIAPETANIGPERTAGANALDQLAYTTAEKTMKIPPSIKAGNRDTAINTLLNEKVLISKGGLKKTQGLLDDLEGQMDAAVANSPAKDNLIAIDSALGPVNELRNMVSNTVNGAKLTKDLDAVIDGFKSQFGNEITVEQAQVIKQNTNALLKKAYGQLQGVETEAQKQIVRGLKDRIAQEIPEITGINKRYSNLKLLEPVLERAVNRTGNWDILSLSSALVGGTVGGATGSVAKAGGAAALWRILKSPQIQSGLAIGLKQAGVGSKANFMANAIINSVYHKATGLDAPAEE